MTIAQKEAFVDEAPDPKAEVELLGKVAEALREGATALEAALLIEEGAAATTEEGAAAIEEATDTIEERAEGSPDPDADAPETVAEVELPETDSVSETEAEDMLASEEELVVLVGAAPALIVN